MLTAAELEGTAFTGSFAPAYYGFVVSLVLCGITVVQGYIYFPRPNDKLSIQLTAGTMLALDLASTVLVTQFIYYYMIPHHGILPSLTEFTPTFPIECLVSNTITFISQMYFVHQLYHMKLLGKGSWVAIILIALFAVVAYVCSFGCVVTMYMHHLGLRAKQDIVFMSFFSTSKGFAFITDALATVAMCLFLASSKSGLPETNSLLKTLMRFVIQRGALVTVTQLLFLVMFLTRPDHLYWLPFHVNTTKLYANTFFAMLNARDHLKMKHSVVKSGSTLVTNEGRRSTTNHVDLASLEFQEFSEGKMSTTSSMPTVTKSVFIADV